MKDSKQLAGLIGPTMVTLAVTEAVNIDVFANQTAPVYLNGAILFVAGLAVISAHHLWIWRWPVIMTLTDWAALIGDPWRMAMPHAPQMTENVMTYSLFAAVGASSAILSFKPYGSQAPLRADTLQCITVMESFCSATIFRFGIVGRRNFRSAPEFCP